MQLQQKHFHFKNQPITNTPVHSEEEMHSFLHIKTGYAQNKPMLSKGWRPVSYQRLSFLRGKGYGSYSRSFRVESSPRCRYSNYFFCRPARWVSEYIACLNEAITISTSFLLSYPFSSWLESSTRPRPQHFKRFEITLRHHTLGRTRQDK